MPLLALGEQSAEAEGAFPYKVVITPAGRSCRATRRLRAREVVLRCAPIAAVLTDGELRRRCSRCFEPLSNPAQRPACRRCGAARFCAACHDGVGSAAARAEHRSECRALRLLWSDRKLRRRLGLGAPSVRPRGSVTTQLRLAVRLLAVRARYNAGRRSVPLLSDEDGGGGAWLPAPDEDVIHDSWGDLEALMPRDAAAVDHYVLSLSSRRAMELEGGANAIQLLARVGLGDVHRLLCQMTCNSMTLAPEAKVRQATATGAAGSWSDFGVGLFPSGAMLNHSCAPTCLWFVRGGVLVVETARAVRPGEELTIQYLPATGILADRRRQIKDTFGFHCLCHRCVAEEASDNKARPRSPRKRPAGAVAHAGASLAVESGPSARKRRI